MESLSQEKQGINLRSSIFNKSITLQISAYFKLEYMLPHFCKLERETNPLHYEIGRIKCEIRDGRSAESN